MSDEQINRLIDRTAQFESGRSYTAWTPNDNGAGVSFGLIQFNQKRGSLGQLLRRMASADRFTWDLLVKPEQSAILLDQQRLEDTDLTAAPWPGIFEALGKHPPFQAIQRDLAREGYFLPAADLAGRYGLDSEQAYAVLFDVAVQHGVKGLADRLATQHRTALELSGSPVDQGLFLDLLAESVDGPPTRANLACKRRWKLLRSAGLSKDPLDLGLPAPERPTLRVGDHGTGVKDLQKLLAELRLYPAGAYYPVFGRKTRDAVLKFQRMAGLDADGIAGPKTWTQLHRFVTLKRRGQRRPEVGQS